MIDGNEDRTLKAVERATYLDTIRARAAKVMELCDSQTFRQVPDVQSYLLAQQVNGLILASIGICRGDLTAAIEGWMQAKVREDHLLCGVCGNKLPGDGSVMCPDCVASVKRFEEEFDLGDLAPGRTRTDAELGAIAKAPDTRD